MRLLQEQLRAARTYDANTIARTHRGEIIQVPGIGKNISNAYELLRRAAESAEEHLLLQKAIYRFYKRSVVFSSTKKSRDIGDDLILELTHAGYLPNNSVSTGTAKAITQIVDSCVEIYRQMGKAKVPRDERLGWVLDLMSVETEALLNPHHKRAAIAYVAYQHYLDLFPRFKLTSSPEDEAEYEFSLYLAVYQVLLKADLATVRYDMVRTYRQTPKNLEEFIDFNRFVDRTYTSLLTQRIKRAVTRYAGPFRILHSLSDDRNDLPELLANREAFLKAYTEQIGKEYGNVAARLKRGIAKSILFIFITKVSVGLAIEIPYDIVVLGGVALLPLAVNLFFPPLYMASFKLSLRPPSAANASALYTYISQSLYEGGRAVQSVRVGIRPMPTLAKVFYSLLFFIPLALVTYLLSILQFTVIQGIIFFVFLSTASFLGFRLSRMAKELELVRETPNLSGAIRDFLYLPFVVAGQWISSKYARLNIIAYTLDVLVELPLKTVLKLIRQWTRFLSEKHEEIM